jgi:hypothetical protein
MMMVKNLMTLNQRKVQKVLKVEQVHLPKVPLNQKEKKQER